MEWWLIIIGLMFIVIFFIVDIKNWNNGFRILTLIYGVLLFLSACLLFGDNIGEKQAYINILRGKPNPYKMEIAYQLEDSIYVPVDTLFIKIEK